METPHTKMTGYQHPGFEDEADSNDSADQRIVLDAKNANEMNRGYVCRCLGPCGKQTLQHKPSDGLCPTCGSYCAPATFASRRQTKELAEKCWTVVDSNSLAHAIRELGLVPMAVVGDLESDLHKIARGRNDDYRRSHLFAHRHIVERPGLANGDLKSMGALSRALRRDTTVPKFVRAPDRQSPGVIGLLVEAELEFRANRRQLRGLSMRSKLYRYLHPTLGLTYGPITVEIDGEYEALPVELKTVSTFDALECNQRKMRAMIMQLAGQAIAKNVDEGVLIIAEREGSRLTAIRIGNLRQYHCNNVARWIAELGINPESTDTMHKDWIGNYNQTSFTSETQEGTLC